jgi:hypothetical protein
MTSLSTTRMVGSLPTSQQLLNYANALIVVNNYAYAITNQTIPTLSGQQPPDYASFAEQFAPAKLHALNWSTNIFVSMIQLPSTIVNQAAGLFNMEKAMIKSFLDILISDPGNQQAKSRLNVALTDVQTMIHTQIATVQNIETQLNTFAGQIAIDAVTLAGIATEATNDATITDKQAIINLKADIQRLNNEIANLNLLMGLSEVGIPISIFVGLVGAVVCFIPGATAYGVGLIAIGVTGLAASIAGTVITNIAVSDANNVIQGNRTNIANIDQDISLLNALSSQFTNLYNANVAAASALTTIKTMWTSLESTINQVNTDLTTVGSDITSSTYQQALQDFRQAETDWNAFVSFARLLANINYSWQDASGNWHNYQDQSPAANNGNVNQMPSSQAA